MISKMTNRRVLLTIVSSIAGTILVCSFLYIKLDNKEVWSSPKKESAIVVQKLYVPRNYRSEQFILLLKTANSQTIRLDSRDYYSRFEEGDSVTITFFVIQDSYKLHPSRQRISEIREK